MARIRTIKPDFWEDETIATLSLRSRLLFIATWNLADDDGILRWTPEYIDASVFMYDALPRRQVTTAMKELEDAGLIHPYQAGKTQQRLGYVVNFRKHQRINRPQPSRFPHPEAFIDSFSERRSERVTTDDVSNSLGERKGKEGKGNPPTPHSEEPPPADESAGVEKAVADKVAAGHVPAVALKALKLHATQSGWKNFTAAMKQFALDGTLDTYAEMARRFPTATVEQIPQLVDRGPLFQHFVEQEQASA